jgi:hypothetical protein
MPTISQEYHAEVAQRPKAPVLKTGCATHSGSSNLPLGVTVFDENYIIKESKDVNISINEFRTFWRDITQIIPRKC